MPYGSAKNGRNNCRHHLRSITNQNIIDEIVESRIDGRDSTWRPNESPTEIRRDMFEQARMFSENLGCGGGDTNTSSVAYDAGNGTTLNNGTTYNGRSCNGSSRYSNGASRSPTTTTSAITPCSRPRWQASPTSPLNGRGANGDARQADSLSNNRVVGHNNSNNNVNSWEKDVPTWRSRSSSSERRRVFGSQNMDGDIEYGDMALYNAAVASRTTQTSPINLSLSKTEAAPLNLTNTKPSSSSERELPQSGSSGKSSCSSNTDVAPTLSRTNSDEVGDSGQSHWKKNMISNITQQERQ